MRDMEPSGQLNNLDTTRGEPQQEALAPIERTIQATYDQLESCIELAKSVMPVSDVAELLNLLPPGSIESQRFLLGELIKLDMAAIVEAAVLSGAPTQASPNNCSDPNPPTDPNPPGIRVTVTVPAKHAIPSSEQTEVGDNRRAQTRLLEFYLPACQRWFGPSEVPLDLVLEEMQIRRQAGDTFALGDYQVRFPHWSDALADMLRESGDAPKSSVPPPKRGLPELEIGQTIDDFQVLRCLGRGGFAQVYLAYQQSMQRLVALKVSKHSSEEPQTLSQLDHPNIVRVYDQRTVPALGVHLLYMQAILGGTLAGLVKATRERSLRELTGNDVLVSVDQALVDAHQQPPERLKDPVRSMNWAATVAWIGSQLADGLQAAHHSQILHLDVKPANVLLSPTGSPKLVDFNVSDRGLKALHERRVGGTLPYMSPEHLTAAMNPLQSEHLDHRSDIYSLALTLWELWQGERPWRTTGTADSWSTAIHEQVALRNQSLSLRRIDTSPEGVWLEQVLRTALDPLAERRPQRCTELATRLKLTQHPEMVVRFAPAEGTMAAKLLTWPVLLVTTVIAFPTNVLMGCINYFYNLRSIIRPLAESESVNSATADPVKIFETVSVVLNLVAFPVAGAFLVFFSWLVQRSLRRSSRGGVPTEFDIDFAWRFGHRAAVISGALWLTFGLIFPIVLSYRGIQLPLREFLHFFASLSICGGIALICPFFGISLLSTYIYYPRLILQSMKDDQFSHREAWLRRRADNYLALALVVPLLALGLLAVMSRDASGLQVLLVIIAAVSLVASFKAYQLLSKVLGQYGKILHSQSSNDSVPSV